MNVVFTLEDGSRNAVPVNDASTVTVKTWRPPVFSAEGGSPPILAEDQTVSLAGVIAISLDQEAPADATVLGAGQGPEDLEMLSDAEAKALDAEFVDVPMPWELPVEHQVGG